MYYIYVRQGDNVKTKTTHDKWENHVTKGSTMLHFFCKNNFIRIAKNAHFCSKFKNKLRTLPASATKNNVDINRKRINFKSKTKLNSVLNHNKEFEWFSGIYQQNCNNFESIQQKWSPRGHILKSLALASKVKSLASRPQVLENWPVLGSRTALFFELLKFCGELEKFLGKRLFVEIAWKIFVKTFFFLDSTCACVHGPWPGPPAFLSLASRVSVLGKVVLGLGLEFFCVLGLEPCVLDSTSAIQNSCTLRWQLKIFLALVQIKTRAFQFRNFTMLQKQQEKRLLKPKQTELYNKTVLQTWSP